MRNGTSFPVESARRKSSSEGRKASSVAGGSATLTSPASGISIGCRCCHSVNVAATEWPATKLASNSPARSRSRRKRSFVFISPGKSGGESLIEERRDDCDHGDAHQRADAIKLGQLRKVVEEQLQERDAQQRERGVTCRRDPLDQTRHEQQERKQRPGDAVTHVAREVSRKLERQRRRSGFGEKVGDLDVHEQKRQNRAQGVKHDGRLDRQDAVTRRREQSRAGKQAEGYQSVSVKIPVQDGSGAARVVAQHGGVESQSNERRGQQRYAGEAQSGMLDAMEQPAQRRAFQRPRDRQPLPLVLDRENQCDKKQGAAAEQRQ